MSFIAQMEEIARKVVATVRHDVTALEERVHALEAKVSGGGDVVETAAKAPRGRGGRTAKTEADPAGEPDTTEAVAAKTDGK